MDYQEAYLLMKHDGKQATRPKYRGQKKFFFKHGRLHHQNYQDDPQHLGSDIHEEDLNAKDWIILN